MSRYWRQDKRWTDRLMPEIQKALSDTLRIPVDLIAVSERSEDILYNTDLIVLLTDRKRIGVRIRQWRYFVTSGYRTQFTLRANRPNRRETELDKILAGWGDYFLYGFASEDRRHLIQWLIIDLCVFRSRYHAGMGKRKENQDGSSSFLVFEVNEFPYLAFLQNLR